MHTPHKDITITQKKYQENVETEKKSAKTILNKLLYFS